MIPTLLLKKHVEEHPYPLIFTTISGAHLYGFPSPDSDFDLRGVHILPLKEVVGLRTGPETIEKTGVHDGLEIDLVTHEAKKFFTLLLKKNGYVMSQFKKMQADIRNKGQVKWKHVMHLIRLLLSGIGVLRDGFVPVKVDAHRDRLLAIRRGEVPWQDVESWRLSLHHEFNAAFEATKLPERPDYERANAFLISARRRAASEGLP